MNKLLGVVAGVVLAGVATAGAGEATAGAAPAAAATEAKVVKMQSNCPVMKANAINKKLYMDHDGKRIYVCCAGCIGTIKKDPAKYVKEIEAAGFTLEQAPVETPAAGK